MKKGYAFLWVCLFLFSSLHALAPSSKPSKYKYEVAACMIFQNESFFMKEWIEYHKMIGVQHFYLFNNGSTDNYLEILQPYIESGLVELHQSPGHSQNQSQHNTIQCNSYKRAIALAKGKAKWLAIIDADEFIYPVQGDNIGKLLRPFEGFGGVYINYRPFGTSHVERIPSNRLIIETLTRCGEVQNFGKSIVRPERVRNVTDPHRMWYVVPFFHVNTKRKAFNWKPQEKSKEVMLLHHYCMGDMDHAIHVKYPRRIKWTDIKLDRYLKQMEPTNKYENQEILRFVPQLRKNMNME